MRSVDFVAGRGIAADAGVSGTLVKPVDYDASPFVISMCPSIDEFTEHGQIVIGYLEPVGAVGIAKATIDDVYVAS